MKVNDKTPKNKPKERVFGYLDQGKIYRRSGEVWDRAPRLYMVMENGSIYCLNDGKHLSASQGAGNHFIEVNVECDYLGDVHE